MEYNLYGMGFVRLRKARFRGEVPQQAGALRVGWAPAVEIAAPEMKSTGAAGVTVAGACSRFWMFTRFVEKLPVLLLKTLKLHSFRTFIHQKEF